MRSKDEAPGAVGGTGGSDQEHTGSVPILPPGGDISRPYAAGWRDYWAAGWRGVIRLPERAKALPPTGFSGRAGIDPSYADCQAWADETAASNIGLRLSATEVGIDKDCWDGKTGDASIAAKEAEWGPLPKTWRSTSRGFDTGNGIWLYRIPEGVELTEQPLKDVEIIQRHHRYAVCWPSINPLTGLVYQWVDDDGRPVEPPRPLALPKLQAPWINGLYEAHRASGAPSLDSADMEVLMTDGEPEGRVQHFVTRAIEHLDTGVGSRFDNTRDTVLALLRCGLDGDLGVRDAIDTLREEYVLAVTSTGDRTDAVARSEFERMITNPRAALLLSEPSHADLFSAFPQP